MIQDTEKVAKVLFLCPVQELLDRKLPMLKQFCDSFDRKIGILTGVTNTDMTIIETSNFIVATAEHFDNITRRWQTKRIKKLIRPIRLAIVDHLHLLNSNEAVYEVIISRLRYIFIELDIQLRFIAMACSTANSRDVCDWLGVEDSCIFNFHPNVRPIGLDIYIYGFDHYAPKSRFHSMTRNLYRSINLHTTKESILIFVSDRKSARLTAADLYSYARCEGTEERFLNLTADAYRDLFQRCLEVIKDTYLNFYLSKGNFFLVAKFYRYWVYI
jgi:pre-mRNA-splicing helicase BRR2